MNSTRINTGVFKELIPRATNKESLYFGDGNDNDEIPYIFDIAAASSYCIVSGSNNEFRYYNYNPNSIVLTEKLLFHSDIITKIKLYNDQLFFSSSKDGTVVLWDLRLLRQIPVQILKGDFFF